MTLASLKSGPRDARACPKQAEAGGLSFGIAAVSHTTVRAVGARLGPPLLFPLERDEMIPNRQGIPKRVEK